MGLIYSQGVDLVLSILILFHFIITSFERETGKNEIEIFYFFFFFLLLINEFHSVKATLGSFHRESPSNFFSPPVLDGVRETR
jgi:hypothetical protein